jgi:DNA polymerase-3 subunit beta
MKATIKVKIMQQILDVVMRFVSKNSTLPILGNIYIKGNIDSLILRATDMEKYIEVEMPALIDIEWALTIDARTLTEFIKTIEDEDAVLSIDPVKDLLMIKTKSDDIKIKWIPASEYVALPQIQVDNKFQLEINQFVQGIHKVDYAVSDKNYSPVMTGVLMRIKKDSDDVNKLIFVGTDWYRLAEYKMIFSGIMTKEQIDVIIPKGNIWEILKVAEYVMWIWGETMLINYTDNLVSFEFTLENTKIYATSLLIQGNFPEYDNVNIIPIEFHYKLVVNKVQLEKAIKKINILTKDLSNYILCDMNNNTLVLKSGITEKWEWESQLQCLTQWEALAIWLNGKYILDFIRAIGSNDMTFSFVSAEKPIILTDYSDSNYKYVIRPVTR